MRKDKINVKYIIVIDGKITTRYIYNVWSVFEYEDRSVSQDTRIFESDNVAEFIEFMSHLANAEHDAE